MNITGSILKAVFKTEAWDHTINALAKINVRIGNHEFKTSKYVELKKILDEDPTALYAFVTLEKNSACYLLQHKFLESEFSHAGIVLRGTNSDDVTVIHVMRDGLHVEHILDFIDKVDRFVLIKLPIVDEHRQTARDRIIDFIQNKKDVKYDTTFTLRNGKRILYCSEFVYQIGVGLVTDPDFKPHWTYGIEYLSPDDLLKTGIVLFNE